MPAVVAVFDFDGTLSARDSLLPFLRRVVGARRLAVALVRHGVDLVLMTAGRRDRDEVKAVFLADLLRGASAAEVAGVGNRYAGELAGQLRPTTLARLREHQSLGHTVLIVSASPGVYLEPLGIHLGVDAVVSTELEVRDGVLTGELVGGNCRAAEKARRLTTWLDGREATVHAYGDSEGDRELLELADFAYWVRKGEVPPLAT